PDFELDLEAKAVGGRATGSLAPGERPFAAVGVVPAGARALAPSSRHPPAADGQRGPISWAPASQPPRSQPPPSVSPPGPRSLRDPRLAPKSKSNAGIVVALVFVLLAVMGVGAFGARLLGLF
ncbi:MAG: hypothetical protein JRI68_16145, partial [Deltaproteobacteria bacterium]|nr:hypothetical protein [Deltaproteobacteria bacterium]